MKPALSAAMLCVMAVAAPMHAQEPQFRLKDLNDEWQEFDDLKGASLTVIDFWATWCQPCVRSIPLLNEMALEFAEEGVTFIGVSIDGPRNQSKVKPFIQALGVTYPVIRDLNSDLMSDLGVTAVPTLLIYDSEGDQVYFHEGFRPGDEISIRDHIRELLAK